MQACTAEPRQQLLQAGGSTHHGKLLHACPVGGPHAGRRLPARAQELRLPAMHRAYSADRCNDEHVASGHNQNEQQQQHPTCSKIGRVACRA